MPTQEQSTAGEKAAKNIIDEQRAEFEPGKEDGTANRYGLNEAVGVAANNCANARLDEFNAFVSKVRRLAGENEDLRQGVRDIANDMNPLQSLDYMKAADSIVKVVGEKGGEELKRAVEAEKQKWLAGDGNKHDGEYHNEVKCNLLKNAAEGPDLTGTKNAGTGR